MPLHPLRFYHHVINVYLYRLIDLVLKHSGDHLLIYGSYILLLEGHYSIVVIPLGCDEECFLLVLGC